mmetsp:Transcript_30165/g.63523  ORF Transcript_30165/g.63523 Transcript_30165/m.63523 type:complete len:89 (-) Transcript_30165:412-678(-)
MYEIVYDEMVCAKVAMKLETPVFMNRKGEQVDESQQFGKEVDMQLTHTTYVLFGDETGCNTSMKKTTTLPEQSTSQKEEHGCKNGTYK